MDLGENEKHLWPEGFNFKSKSKFIGITNKGEKIILTQELLDCNMWGMSFESHDKEFNDAVNGLLEGE